MTDTDFLQPDPGPLRAAAEAAELAHAAAGLVSSRVSAWPIATR